MQNDLTRKMNRKFVTKHMKVLFNILHKECPKHIIYVRSQAEAQYVANYLDQGEFDTRIKSHNYAINYHWVKNAVDYCKQNNMKIKMFDDSNLLLRIGCYVDVITHSPYVDETLNDQVKAAHIINKYAESIYLFNEVIIISHKPTKVVHDENGMLTFAKYSDGFTYQK